jgi:cation transport ATPase
VRGKGVSGAGGWAAVLVGIAAASAGAGVDTVPAGGPKLANWRRRARRRCYVAVKAQRAGQAFMAVADTLKEAAEAIRALHPWVCRRP